jgi:dihydropteroate synthase
MGILNVTPDSFYAESRQKNEAEVRCRAERIVAEGGRIIDLGGFSTRPDAEEVSEEVEWKRLEPALKILADDFPHIPVSVDTFRAEIARRAVTDYGAAIINDISGGTMDDRMFATVAELGVPYILTHITGTPKTMQQNCNYDNIVEDILMYLVSRVNMLHNIGVNDVIVDPGFGFGKTLDQNYELMSRLNELSILAKQPLLVGISRKSMIYNLLGVTSEESLAGTIALNTFALLKGADILRVHDVRAAVDTVKIVNKLKNLSYVDNL